MSDFSSALAFLFVGTGSWIIFTDGETDLLRDTLRDFQDRKNLKQRRLDAFGGSFRISFSK